MPVTDDRATLSVDGQQVPVPDDGSSLLDVLRDRLGIRSAKDGCSPQGQCGCCTVLVDGAPRVACVTPARRMAGRSITTLAGLEPAHRERWADVFCSVGASQCGFCTPGIIVRLEALATKATPAGDPAIARSLQSHLCRCTGWRTILEAYDAGVSSDDGSDGGSDDGSVGGRLIRPDRDLAAAARRATVEGRSPQRVSPSVALGDGGFADDTAPDGALVAVPDRTGGWAVGESVAEARSRAGRVQGRRTTVEARPPLEVPEGAWDVSLRTSWVEPAYLETDAAWCRPGGEPASPLANGGAFGGKQASPAPAAARRLADEHGRPVRVLLSREDTVRLGPKRPPIAAGLRLDGTGVLRAVRTPGFAEAVGSVAPGLTVEEVDVSGPPTSSDLRGAGWTEAAVLLAACSRPAGPVTVTSPEGAVATAGLLSDGVHVSVSCGDPLDEVVLRSYCIGAAHMAMSWVTSEGLAVDGSGAVQDLTVRSFGVLRAIDTPSIEVVIERATAAPVNGSDAVFAAVAAAVWIDQGCPPAWPTGRLPCG